jgi:DNA-binding beta-propeller fold protein YncE
MAMKVVRISWVLLALAGAGCSDESGAGGDRDGAVADERRDAGGEAPLPPLPGEDAGPTCASPKPETCDGVDEDCDGLVDEDSLLACAPCAEGGCVEATIVGGAWRTGVARNVQVGGDRGVRLPPLPGRNDYVYVANAGDDTVSKLRAADGVEVARILVGDNPSRTAVDGDGNAWVAMRGVASGIPDEVREHVVKIDGKCTPSIAPPRATRECILLDIPDVGDTLRGLAVDAEGHVWVGSFATFEVVKIHGRTGRILARVSMKDIDARPYGLAIDEHGYVWVASRETDTAVVRVDPVRLEIDPAFVFERDRLDLLPYGIAADGDGGMWFGTFSGEVFRIDVVTGGIGPVHDVGSATRGVAVDDAGKLWVADSGLGQVHRMDRTSGDIELSVDVGQGPVGVAVDHDGNIWAVNQYDDDAVKLAPDGEVLGTFPVGSEPYTYSDMTGSAFRVFRRLRGTFTATYGTGVPGARWTGVRWAGDAPAPSTVSLRVRAFDDDADTAWKDVAWTGREAALEGLAGAHVEVEVTLESGDRSAIPNVDALTFTYQLP